MQNKKDTNYMKIKQRYKIGGHWVKVILEDDMENIAETDSANNEIKILSTASQSQKEQALIHEAMHMMNTTFDDGMAHNLLGSLSEQLYQFLKDNKIIE